jgi:aryl-alcohol dehydrogenase-like predicted oxidoreductase
LKNNLYLPLDPIAAKITEIWLGTWVLGGEGFGPADENMAKEVIEKALELGIRNIDTAGFYGHGNAEKIISKVIKSNRKQVFISTKGGLVWEGRSVAHDGSKRNLRESLFLSLDRLKTDYIDLYQLHWPDPKVDIAESILALKELQNEGLIRFWGVGNLSAKQVLKYLKPNELIPHQVHFNPIQRDFEILAAGKKENRCFNCVYSPLEQGLLAGKNLADLGNKDIRHRNFYFKNEQIFRYIKNLQAQIKDNFAAISISEAVFLWILAQKEVDVVICGPRNINQLLDIFKVTEMKADPQLLAIF